MSRHKFAAVVLTAIITTLFGAINAHAACNKTAVENTPAFKAYTRYNGSANKCEPVNVESLVASSKKLGEELAKAGCTWQDMGLVEVKSGKDAGCGGGNPAPPAASRPANDPRSSVFYIKHEGRWWSYRLAHEANFGTRDVFIKEMGPRIDAQKDNIKKASPALEDIIKASPALKRAIKNLKQGDKEKLLKLIKKLEDAGIVSFAAVGPIIVALKSYNVEDRELDKIFDELVKKVQKALAACTYGPDSDAVSAKENELKKLRADLAKTPDDLALDDKIKDSERELDTIKRTLQPNCPPSMVAEINAWINSIGKLDKSKLSAADQAEVTRLLGAATAAKRMDNRITIASQALDLFDPSSDRGCTDCPTNNGTKGCTLVGGRLIPAEKRPWWLPGLQIRLNPSFFMANLNAPQHGRDFNVKANGFGFDAALDIEGAWKMHKLATLIYGGGLLLGYRKTFFLHQEAASQVTSSGLTFAAQLRLGVNVANWFSASFITEGRPFPAGFGVGGGLELTRWWLRPGVNIMYQYVRDNIDLGVAGAPRRDFKGLVIGPYLGVAF